MAPGDRVGVTVAALGPLSLRLSSASQTSAAAEQAIDTVVITSAVTRIRRGHGEPSALGMRVAMLMHLERWDRSVAHTRLTVVEGAKGLVFATSLTGPQAAQIVLAPVPRLRVGRTLTHFIAAVVTG